MQVSNRKIPKNKVIPVQVLEGKQELNAGDEKDGNTENRWDSVLRKISPSSTSVPSSPEKKNSRHVSPIRTVTQVKVNALKWRRFARKRSVKRNLKQYEKIRISLPKGLDKFRTCRMNAAQLSDLEDMVDESNDLDARRKQRKNNPAINSPSRALMYYFTKLASSSDEDQVIDLDFVDTLITNGASPTICDRHGQSILHEAARQWELGVAKFLLEKGKWN